MSVVDEVLKECLRRRIVHARRRVEQIKAQHGDNPVETHTYHGGVSLGLWQGRLSTYEDILDMLTGEDD